MFFCLILISLPISMSYGQNNSLIDDVEIEIYAGQFLKKNIGFGITIYVVNHKPENITLNEKMEFNYLFRKNWNWTHEWNNTIPSENPWEIRISTQIVGIKYITITASVEGTVVTRSGISIGRIMIFLD